METEWPWSELPSWGGAGADRGRQAGDASSGSAYPVRSQGGGRRGSHPLSERPMPPSTLRFFDDEAFTKLAQATPQGLATDIGLDSSLDFNGLCVVERLGGHERLSRCRITRRVRRRGLASPPGLYVLETHEPWRVGGVAAAVTVDGAGFDRATDCLGGDPNSGGGGGEGCPWRSSGIRSFVAGLVIHVLISALLPRRLGFGGFSHWIIIRSRPRASKHPAIPRTPTLQ